MKTQDIKNIASAYKQVLENKTNSVEEMSSKEKMKRGLYNSKLDPVNPDELKGTHDQRKDKDIDNDGKVDSTDKYLHTRRKAVKQAMAKEAKDYGPGHIGAVQKMLDKERDAKKAKDAMKKEEVNLDEVSNTVKDQLRNIDLEISRLNRRHGSGDIGDTGSMSAPAKIQRLTKQKQDIMKKHGMKEAADYPHMMYHPDTGKSVEVKSPEEHNMYAKKGYTHDKPKMDEAMTKAQIRALQSVKAQPKDKVSLKPSPFDKKKDDKMNESRWPILQRIMERQNHGNMDNGSPRGEGLSPSAKAELARSEGDSGIDGAKAAADTARNAVAQVKVAPKRPGDKTDGDKRMPNNDGK